MDSTRLAMVTLDCDDPQAEAQFWAQLLGLEQAYADDNYAMLKGPQGPAIGFGRVEDYVPPVWPNPHGSKQFHLDVAVTDIAEAEVGVSSWVPSSPIRSPGRPGGS
jgi:catechol 2,3-dioxygenase-like lactoylglutathione lyase family enzyme